MHFENIFDRLKQSVFLVEANSSEFHFLWERWSKEGHSLGLSDKPTHLLVTWVNIHGCLTTIENVRVQALSGKRYETLPIVISFTSVLIDDKIVTFWYCSSQLIDHRRVDKFLDEHYTGVYDNGTRRARCDSDSFVHCIHFIKGS